MTHIFGSYTLQTEKPAGRRGSGEGQISHDTTSKTMRETSESPNLKPSDIKPLSNTF